MDTMSRLVLIIITVLLLAAGSAFAGTGAADVANTPHNLSWASYPGDFTYTYAADNSTETEICVYCHTPHGGTLDAPLWNRNLDAQGLRAKSYQTYVGVEMALLGIGVSRTINKESLICLSCHDGSIGVGDIINNAGNGTPKPSNAGVMITGPGFGSNPGVRIGASGADMAGTNDLRDDHPISFSYAAVLAADTSKLQPVAHVEDTKFLKLRFWRFRIPAVTCA